MESYFNIDNSFGPIIKLSTDKITIDDAIEKVNSNSGIISEETGIVDVLVEGLNSSTKNSDCYSALIDIYVTNPGKNIQYDIINKLTWSDSPGAQFLMEEILSDSTNKSLSSRFDETEKENLLSIMRLSVDQRANAILEQINVSNPDYPTDIPINYDIVRGVGIRVDTYKIVDPNVENSEGGNDPNHEILKRHLVNLANSNNYQEAIATLTEQISENPDFGRKMGQLMQQDTEFRETITDVFLKVAAENPNDELILKNTLSYCRQVGEDISITYMTENQKFNLIPKLKGESTGDKIYFAQDDLLTRLDAGESISLNTLSNEGLVAIPILLNIKLKL